MAVNNHSKSVSASADQRPVDEKGRRAVQAQGVPALDVRIQHVEMGLVAQALIEFQAVQVKLGGEGLQARRVEITLVFTRLILEKVIVVLPEHILIAGAKRRQRGEMGFISARDETIHDRVGFGR